MVVVGCKDIEESNPKDVCDLRSRRLFSCLNKAREPDAYDILFCTPVAF